MVAIFTYSCHAARRNGTMRRFALAKTERSQDVCTASEQKHPECKIKIMRRHYFLLLITVTNIKAAAAVRTRAGGISPNRWTRGLLLTRKRRL